MKKLLLGTAVFCILAAGVQAADPLNAATYIPLEDWQKVMQLDVAGSIDHTIRTVDIGQGAQMSVAIIRRGGPPTGTPAPAARPPADAAAESDPRCGPATAPPGAKLAPGAGYLSHDMIGETYYITKGEGTLVTGGTMYGGKHDVRDVDGPGCSGKVFGDVHVQNVKPGDIIVVPARLPHGFSSIPNGIEYLVFRADPKSVLTAGFVSPALSK